MTKQVEMSGRRVGKLFVLRHAESQHLGAHWLCRCDCGKEIIVSGKNLRKRQKSCGCGRVPHRTHGMSDSRTYRVWTDMLRRCDDARRAEFINYGARGITVCSRWHKFENFLADMGEVQEGHSIERRNNDGNYEKYNCCWVLKVDQAKNRRNTHYIEVGGERIHMSEAARRAGIGITTLCYRLKAGWPVERALDSIP